MTEDMELYIIELPKLRKKLKNKETITNKKLVSWLKFIQNPNELEEEDMKVNKELEEAFKIINDVNADEYEKDLAEKRIDWIRRTNDLKNWERNKGSRLKAKEIAKKLLEMNMSTSEIIEITGLTKEEIEHIDEPDEYDEDDEDVE